MSGARAGARLLLLSRHISRSSFVPTFVSPLLARAMSTDENQATGASAPRVQVTPGSDQEPKRVYNFPVSEIPKNPLGEGRYIRTAAALIIG